MDGYARRMQTRVSSKGQITIPAVLLRDLDLTPGTRLFVVRTGDSIVLVPVRGSLTQTLAGSTGGAYGDAREYVEAERGTWS